MKDLWTFVILFVVLILILSACSSVPVTQISIPKSALKTTKATRKIVRNFAQRRMLPNMFCFTVAKFDYTNTYTRYVEQCFINCIMLTEQIVKTSVNNIMRDVRKNNNLCKEVNKVYIERRY